MEQLSLEPVSSEWSSAGSSLDVFEPRVAGHSSYFSQDSAALCAGCAQRFDESHFLRVGARCDDADTFYHMHEYNISRKELRLNKEQGCRLCDIMDYQGKGSRDVQTIEWALKCHPNKAGEALGLPDVRELAIQYYKPNTEKPRDTRGYTLLYAHASHEDPAGRYVSARDIISDFSSDKSFDQVMGWLKDCNELHEGCGRPDTQPLPTRVIQIPASDDDLSELRLIRPAGVRDNYAAFSYAWGADVQPNMTTRSNEEAHYKQIIFSDLPKSLQDAITVTRKLGIKYLWIDSMCIVQDSAEDKAIEISKIRHTFKNAYCTIIGGRATRSSEGFLDPPPLDFPLSAPDISIPYGSSEDGTKKGVMTLRESESLEQADTIRDFTESRAWCLEESLLSPRCVVYSNIRVRWTCAETSHADGDFSYAKDNDFAVEPLPRLFRRGQMKNEQDHDGWEEDWEELWGFWKSCVRNYTRRTLTYPRDKLRAISGLADEIHALYCHGGDDEYLAGVWKRRLFQGLVWFIMPQTRLDGSTWLFPRIPDMAPTWSWASTNGSVMYERESVQMSPHCKIIDWYGSVTRQEPFGRARDASLKLCGRIKQAVFQSDQLSVYDVKVWAALQEQKRQHKQRQQQRQQQQQQRRRPGDSGDDEEEEEAPARNAWMDVVAHGFPDIDETAGKCLNVWCLELGVTGPNAHRTVGLLLVQEGKVYSRCGLYRGNNTVPSWFEGIEPQEICII